MQTEAATIMSVIWLVIYSIVLIALLSVLFYVQRLLRAKLVQSEQTPVDYLLYFKKLKQEGKITAEEFRIIEKALVFEEKEDSDAPNQRRDIAV
ncbi:hypothetical protein FACS189419_03960 [Planctomycetales bacterium]|nr:hypothetical protein FACS189419_03960 [Planctomycetales bacterium]